MLSVLLFFFQNVLFLISRPLKTRQLIEIPGRKFEDLLGCEEIEKQNVETVIYQHIGLFFNDNGILRYLRYELILL